jgi:hypothetical protein
MPSRRRGFFRVSGGRLLFSRIRYHRRAAEGRVWNRKWLNSTGVEKGMGPLTGTGERKPGKKRTK